MVSDKNKKRLKFFLVKLPIFFVILGVICIGALKLVERYPDQLKQGFEKYLSEQTQTKTTIGTLDRVTFFPNVDIHLHHMTMHNQNNAAVIDMTVEKFYVSIPLSGLFIRHGRLHLIDIENMVVEQNIVTPHSLTIESAKIIDKEGPEQYGSFFIANGVYGEKKFNIEAEIEKDRKSYKIPDNLSFSLILGEYQINATTQKKLSTVLLTNLVFQKNNIKTQTKDYPLVEKGNYTTNNPLACLYLHAGDDIKQCDQYLE